MKYFFVKPRFLDTYNYLKSKYGHPESSDLWENPEGWIITEEDMKDIPGEYIIYEIPEKYQDNINEFKCYFWDGDITLKKIN